MNSVCGPRDAQRRLTEENSRQQQQGKWSARRLLRLSAVGVNNCTAGHTHTHKHTAQVEGITVVTAKRNSRSCTHTHPHTAQRERSRERAKNKIAAGQL